MGRQMSGFVRLYRSLVSEHPAFRNDAEAMAFAWLVAKAAWQPVRVRYKERILKLERGQVAVSQRDMARALDRDKAWVERLWRRLRDEAMIRVDSEAGVALITICNYDEYQARGVGREAPPEAPNEAGARQGQGTEQRREEYKKDSEAKASAVETIDPETVMWRHGRLYLQSQGVTPSRAGSLLGCWKKDHGAEAVIVALGKAQREGAIDPVSFINACLGNKKGAGYDPNVITV
jgi:hypothetical protein